MKQVPMLPSEFSFISDQIENNPPIPEDQIALHLIEPDDPNSGNIVGKHQGRDYSADFHYVNGNLVIHGHGVFAGPIVEEKLVDKLTAMLADMRAKK